tara:strand:- start:139 stop:363 length:225 start_codon:yes stop_codon:yes gene_type:complete
MNTLVACLILLILCILGVRKVRKFLVRKKQERLEQEISNDLSEEYPNHDDSTEFIDWVEEMQLDDDIAKKRQLR